MANKFNIKLIELEGGIVIRLLLKNYNYIKLYIL